MEKNGVVFTAREPQLVKTMDFLGKKKDVLVRSVIIVKIRLISWVVEPDVQ